ncbi:MAG: very short patch repair endonuclease, partial [Defluviimonas sp.]|nr:very short patch repair endonuclease [Defluviimonas sp.]
PDIVMPKYRAVIFVHGCFWHRHAGCRYATVPATRPEFWTAKFDANMVRDAAVQSALREAGWRVGTVWECALRTATAIAQTRDMVAVWLHSTDAVLEMGEVDVRIGPRPEPDPRS